MQIEQYAKNYIQQHYIWQQPITIIAEFAVAFDEANVSVDTYPLYALYTQRNVFVSTSRAHIAYTFQFVCLYATCTDRIFHFLRLP